MQYLQLQADGSKKSIMVDKGHSNKQPEEKVIKSHVQVLIARFSLSQRTYSLTCKVHHPDI